MVELKRALIIIPFQNCILIIKNFFINLVRCYILNKCFICFILYKFSKRNVAHINIRNLFDFFGFVKVKSIVILFVPKIAAVFTLIDFISSVKFNDKWLIIAFNLYNIAYADIFTIWILKRCGKIALFVIIEIIICYKARYLSVYYCTLWVCDFVKKVYVFEQILKAVFCMLWGIFIDKFTFKATKIIHYALLL